MIKEETNTYEENKWLLDRALSKGSVTLTTEEACEMGDFITSLPGAEPIGCGWRHYRWDAWFRSDDPGFVELLVRRKTMMDITIEENTRIASQEWSARERDYDRLDQLGW